MGMGTRTPGLIERILRNGQWKTIVKFGTFLLLFARFRNFNETALLSEGEGGGGYEAKSSVMKTSGVSYLQPSSGGGGLQLRHDDGAVGSGISHAAKHEVDIPPVYENIAELGEEFLPGQTPYFWHIPRAGGSTLKDIMGGCLQLTQASDVGARDGHESDTTLGILRKHGGKYVNVDTTKTGGIQHAKELNLVDSQLANVIITGRLVDGATLFPPHFKGRMFAMFRHPMERAISMFYFLGVAKWEQTFDGGGNGDEEGGFDDTTLNAISISELREFLKTTGVENNWMTRILLNKMKGKLYLEDLDTAKEILRRKCLVGLLDYKEESLRRYIQYFHWDGYANQPGVGECMERLLHWGWPNKHRHPMIEEGSEAYELIKLKNEFDMELYEYAKELFEEQKHQFGFYFDNRPILPKDEENDEGGDGSEEEDEEGNDKAEGGADQSGDEEEEEEEEESEDENGRI